ncbi:methylated-DNA--[protein]-cysteine S-methyltransferase [Paenibacillus ihumii]|uniref:methylated-DNA--[protein]-cysteine S-methyltransferase n=1 Tax=Paenibacillus ihumii TaxID=687436 RepID=UPI0006D8588F|nr:methylated-DNA--[protein]-cysteine S-methyltransferase [Paenibacillus ihumii]
MKSTTETVLYWSLLQTDQWHMHLAATASGLCYVGSHNQPFMELSAWASKRFRNHRLIEDARRLQPYTMALTLYLQGEAKEFGGVPLDLPGTEFQRKVWQALMEIPYGETQSYSEIARSIGRSSAVRAVGAAIGANPLLIVIPCHRVLGKHGALTGYRGGLDMKARLMKLEQEYRAHAGEVS